MMQKIHSRAGRLFLLAVGVLLTSTAGHAAARLMAAQMALGHSSFAFELAALIAFFLTAASAVAFSSRKRPETVNRDRRTEI